MWKSSHVLIIATYYYAVERVRVRLDIRENICPTLVPLDLKEQRLADDIVITRGSQSRGFVYSRGSIMLWAKQTGLVSNEER